GDLAREAGRRELPRGEVDGDLERLAPGARAAPARRVPARLAEHPFAEAVDLPALLGERDEVLGEDEAAARMPPPHQRIAPDELAPRHAHDRLEVEDELVPFERALEVEAELHPLDDRLAHLGAEELEPAALRLRARHRDVSVAQHRARLLAAG